MEQATLEGLRNENQQVLEGMGITAAPPEDPPKPSPEPESDPEDQPDEANGEASAEEEDDLLEVILPSAEHRTRKIADQEYVQKPLSFVRRMQFFAVVARALKAALDQGGVNVLSDMFGGTGDLRSRAAALTQSDIQEATEVMHLVFSLVEYSPDLITDCYCVALSVPPHQRSWAKAAWAGDLEEEGIEPLSDKEAMDIIQVFIVQNWEAIKDFFGHDVRELVKVARKQAKEASKGDS